MIMTCIFYSPIIPHAIPLALISTILCYWVTKYSLLRRYKMPEMFSSLMATFFSNFMPWIVLTWSLSAFFLYRSARDSWKEFEKDETTIIFDKGTDSYLTVALVITFLCICLPIRTCINHFLRGDNFAANDKTYEEMALTFATDYDKENPLTRQKGHRRLLKKELEIA